VLGLLEVIFQVGFAEPDHAPGCPQALVGKVARPAPLVDGLGVHPEALGHLLDAHQIVHQLFSVEAATALKSLGVVRPFLFAKFLCVRVWFMFLSSIKTLTSWKYTLPSRRGRAGDPREAGATQCGIPASRGSRRVVPGCRG
jgi:hypothetical protein